MAKAPICYRAEVSSGIVFFEAFAQMAQTTKELLRNEGKEDVLALPDQTCQAKGPRNSESQYKKVDLNSVSRPFSG